MKSAILLSGVAHVFGRCSHEWENYTMCARSRSGKRRSLDGHLNNLGPVYKCEYFGVGDPDIDLN